MSKLTYPDFRDAMRKHGEYTRVQLDGLYTRYMHGDIAPCVVEAVKPHKAETMPVATVPPVVVKAKANPRPEAKNLADRITQIIKILAAHRQPMSLDQIATKMDFTVSHTSKILSKMVDKNLVLVERVRVRQGLQNRYSPVQDAGWRD